MIIYSALVPHSPILIPGIGKNNRDILSKTLEAYSEVESLLYLRQIDTLVIISPHGHTEPDKIGINSADDFSLDFKDFSDYNTEAGFHGGSPLVKKIADSMETDKTWKLNKKSRLDYGTGIPLILLTEKMKDLRILPIYCSESSFRTHFDLGKKLQKIFLRSHNRIAVIASGDLSHRLEKNSPIGYSPKGTKFDQRIIEIIRDPHTAMNEIEKLGDSLIKDAHECALRPLSLLLGILDGINYDTRQLSYDTKLGVGYLTVSFEIE